LALSFKNVFFSSDFDILFRLRAHKSPQTEKIRSQNASDAGAAHNSKASGEIVGRVASLAIQKSMALIEEELPSAMRMPYFATSLSTAEVPLRH
jgi:hypothetical protein